MKKYIEARYAVWLTFADCLVTILLLLEINYIHTDSKLQFFATFVQDSIYK